MLLILGSGFLFAESEAPNVEPSAAEETKWFGLIPELLLRPTRGEAPRYPVDLVIGELGAGSAGEKAYSSARRVMNAFLSENAEDENLSALVPDTVEEILAMIKEVRSSKYRLGSGRIEVDGAASFLFRFVSAEKSVSGELYLVDSDGIWKADYIVAELIDNPSGKLDSNEYFPYERFF